MKTTTLMKTFSFSFVFNRVNKFLDHDLFPMDY